jgi:tRNA A37 threonylcarbamoyladenosine synthetase subunit TsaC/SUA5/YrdC
VAVIFRVEAERLDAALIERAAAMIRDGLVVAYPTDTLYGLAVDPRNSDAVRRLFALKGRPETSALTLIASGNDQVTACAELSPLAGFVLKDRAKLLFQYDFVRDHLARDESGRPTDADNDQFTARLQVEL